MSQPRSLRPSSGVLSLLGAALFLSGLVAAQEPAKAKDEPKKEEPKKEEKPDLLDPSGFKSAQDEMKRLFHEVETNLGKIDVELADAGAGRIPPPEGKESGIEKLLKSTGQKSGDVVGGIDKILELAAQMSPSGSGGTCMKAAMNAQSSGKSPLDKERKTGPTQQEPTPQAPKPQGEKPQDQGQQQPQPQPTKPEGNGKSLPPGQNQPAPPRTDPNGQPVAPGSDAERWGMLPERVRSVFQNQIKDDLPIQYRDWIDSYYKRLNGTRPH